jgi:hypothetical protein
MAITNLIQINSTDLPKLRGWKVGRNKLWTDAGRNMAGELRSTYLGLFPKIELEFAHTTEAEMALIAGLLDNASFTVDYWDVTTQTVKSGTYYASDFSTPMFILSKGLYGRFKVKLVPFSKQT